MFSNPPQVSTTPLRALTAIVSFAALGAHAEDFAAGFILDQFSARRFIKYRDRALFDQPLEQFPGVGIPIGGAVVEFMHAARAGQVGEFDADRRMLMLLRVAAEASSQSLFRHISSAHTFTIGSGTVYGPFSAVR